MMRALTTAFQFWNLKAEGVPLTLIEEPCIGRSAGWQRN
jgi:hypothetical protein